MTKTELFGEMKKLAEQAASEAVKSAAPAQAEKAAPSSDAQVERKYADIYVNHPAAEKPALTLEQKLANCGRAIKCAGMARDYDHAAYIAEKRYNDAGLANQFKALSATNPLSAGVLIPEDIMTQILPMLHDALVLKQMGVRTVPMPHGNISIPKQTKGSTAQYIGEMRTSKPSQTAFGMIKMSAKKLQVKLPYSNDLLRLTNYSADVIFMQDMINAMAQRMEEAAYYGKGTEFEPIGLMNAPGIEHIKLDAIPTQDFPAEMYTKLLTKNANSDSLGWIMSPIAWQVFYNMKTATGDYLYRDELNASRLMLSRFAMSNKLRAKADANASTTIFYGNWSDFMIGEVAGMEIKSFEEASYEDENGNMISTGDRDMTLVRINALHDYGIRYPESFLIIENVHTR